MLTTELLTLRDAEAELYRLTARAEVQSAKSLWGGELKALRPVEDISTLEVAIEHRKIQLDGGGEADFEATKTPYLIAMHREMDNPRIRIVAVKGPARCGKTLTAENFMLKIGMFGPSRNVLWYMHSEGDLKRYVAERVNFFFRKHEDVGRKILRKNPAWNMKEIDNQIWEWAPANASTTRARSASFIMADEIDAMRPAIGDAILTLIRNRQREYGQTAKAYVCSHPDRGPKFGIDGLLEGSDRRIRIWTCPCCAHRMSPAVEALEMGIARVTWNMDRLFKLVEDMEREEFIAHVKTNIRLVCPNSDCADEFGDDERLAMDRAAETNFVNDDAGNGWLGMGQSLDEHEMLAGQMIQKDTAGFVIHAFMSPFVTLAGLAEEWADAKIKADETGSHALLKEVSVKSLGETYRGDEAAAKTRLWKIVKARLVSTTYSMKHVPDGVDFITAQVDVQGNRFEVAMIGWSRFRESWLIDRYSVKQRSGLRDISPGENLGDWDVLEHDVLDQTYAFMNDQTKRLGVAMMVVDTGGVPGVTNNARIWAANTMARSNYAIPSWKLLLMKGDAHIKGEILQKPRPITHDDAGRELATTVFERTVNVHEVKKIIATRIEYERDGMRSGLMHLPMNVEDRHVRELCAETLVNEQWISKGRNELWDQWVAAEVAYRKMAPENVAIDWRNNPPSWSRPIAISPTGEAHGMPAAEPEFLARLRALNQRRRG